jgi:uncharacterized protein YdhG (YjbR/CyaY superfamily)
MRLIKPFFCSLLILTLIFQSCSVEKRHYTSGYNLQWKHAAKPTNAEETKEAVAQAKQEQKVIKLKNASNQKTLFSENINELIASSEKKKRISISPDSIGCDTLILRNETEIKVKVTEITPTEIKYKYCNNLTGPTYVVYRYDVSYIKYANGSLDSFVNEHAPTPTLKNKQFAKEDKYRTENYVSKRSVASIFFGAFSLIPIYGGAAGVIAILLGSKCLRLIDKNPRELSPYKSRATTGFVLGIIGFLISLFIIVLYALMILKII